MSQDTELDYWMEPGISRTDPNDDWTFPFEIVVKLDSEILPKDNVDLNSWMNTVMWYHKFGTKKLEQLLIWW